MVEKATNRDRICEKLEQWFDLMTKRHDEVIQKAKNYIRSEKQASSVFFWRAGKWLLGKIPKKVKVDIDLG